MKPVKFVYFDIGGVLIDDFSGNNKWKQMKNFMGVKASYEKEFDEFYDKCEHSELCLTRPVDSLIPVFEEKFDLKFPENFSLIQYYVDHFDPNPYIWHVVDYVSRRWKKGILSNQYVGMLDLIFDKNLVPKKGWDIVVDSSKVQLQKPDPKIYEYAEMQTGCSPGDILFIDNSQKNIEVAKTCGWQTFLYDSQNHKSSSDKLGKFLIEFR